MNSGVLLLEVTQLLVCPIQLTGDQSVVQNEKIPWDDRTLVRNHSRFIVLLQTLLLSEQLFLNLHGDLQVPVLDVRVSFVSYA